MRSSKGRSGRLDKGQAGLQLPGSMATQQFKRGAPCYSSTNKPQSYSGAHTGMRLFVVFAAAAAVQAELRRRGGAAARHRPAGGRAAAGGGAGRGGGPAVRHAQAAAGAAGAGVGVGVGGRQRVQGPARALRWSVWGGVEAGCEHQPKQKRTKQGGSNGRSCGGSAAL